MEHALDKDSINTDEQVNKAFIKRRVAGNETKRKRRSKFGDTGVKKRKKKKKVVKTQPVSPTPRGKSARW